MLIIAILMQTLVFIKAGINKSYIHMDEAYSLGLASYDKVEIQDNEDFYNTWHNKEYYEDYLSVQKDEMLKYGQVYENQKNDVHPPLYYLLLRIGMTFSQEHFSKWPGIVLNIIIYAFITIFVYLILSKLLEGKSYFKEKSVILAFISAVILASLTNVIYIRMYALSTLNVLIITYLHMKLYESYNQKTLIQIGIAALVGSLTHYYYLFYLAMLYVVTVIEYIKNKEFKNIINYTITLILSGITSLIIFPYSISHMFFGYRGDGVISNLVKIREISFLTEKLSSYMKTIELYVFNNALNILVLAIIVTLVYKNLKKNHNKLEISKYFKFIYMPTIFYFILVSISSPWIELRYVLPICTLIFISLIYIVNQLLETAINKENASKIIGILLIFIIISPFVYKIEPQETYSDKKEIVSKLQNELNLPTIYWFNSNQNRFLDDILLFSKIDKSYIAKDTECNDENVKKILEKENTQNGLIIFINEENENDEILETIKNVTNLEKITHLKRMNACDIYYISK